MSEGITCWAKTRIEEAYVRSDGERISFLHTASTQSEVDDLYRAAEEALDKVGIHLLLKRNGCVEPGEKKDESVLFTTVDKTWKPTHKITFTLHGHEPDKSEYVMLSVEGNDRDAYSRDEWGACADAAWTVKNNEWRYEGNVTPGGANGTVVVESLEDLYGVKERKENV